MYEPKEDGTLELIAVEYITTKGPANLNGHLFNFVTEPNRYGLGPFYELHVWAWRENPTGAFADMNPDVSCDAMNRANQLNRGGSAFRGVATLREGAPLSFAVGGTFNEFADARLRHERFYRVRVLTQPVPLRYRFWGMSATIAMTAMGRKTDAQLGTNSYQTAFTN